jgi:hypothetical protein
VVVKRSVQFFRCVDKSITQIDEVRGDGEEPNKRVRCSESLNAGQPGLMKDVSLKSCRPIFLHNILTCKMPGYEAQLLLKQFC